MKIRSMRWGYDGGGIACGPVDGNTIVELMVTGDDNHNYFLMEAKLCDGQRIDIAEIPMFDILMGAAHWEVDTEYEFKKIDTAAIETYDFEDGDIPVEMGKSKFAEILRLLHKIMLDYYNMPGQENADPDDYIKEYLDKDF